VSQAEQAVVSQTDDIQTLCFMDGLLVCHAGDGGGAVHVCVLGDGDEAFALQHMSSFIASTGDIAAITYEGKGRIWRWGKFNDSYRHGGLDKQACVGLAS
jgi:hypothetical protein